MMKLKTMLQHLLRSPREFPVEAILGLVFFGIAAWHTTFMQYDESTGQRMGNSTPSILLLFVPLLVLTFYLHKVNRWAYVASGFLFLPLMAVNLWPFLQTYGFYFTYVLAAILLVIGTRRMDNRTFGEHALHVATQLFFGFLISGALTVAAVAIAGSVDYIFNLHYERIYEYIWQFIWLAIAPQVCCSLIAHGEDEEHEPAKVLQLMLNFILSPAVIIYTVILYLYFIKITLEWDLPKGGVAWMVMAFITVALVGCLAQHVLSRRYYDWFYRRFTWIAIPPLIMFWVGSLYRIRLYGFTESRFYLTVAGVLMTLFVLMLLWRRTNRFQLMTLIFGAAVVLFTYIPGISAHDIGLKCQQARLKQLITQLNLADPKTGKLHKKIATEGIVTDSLLCMQYREACNVIRYVNNGMGDDKFVQQYGEWDMSEYDFNFQRWVVDDSESDLYWMKQPVDLGDYRIMGPADDYTSSMENGRFVVRNQLNEIVMSDPINERVKNDPQWKEHLEQVMVCRNDSLLIVLSNIWVEKDSVERFEYNNIIYKKAPRR